MARFEWYYVILGSALLIAARCDDRIHFREESASSSKASSISSTLGKSEAKTNLAQPRFLPFSASFAVSDGANNAHSLSIGGSPNGISVSHSASQSNQLSPFGNSGSLTASQASSFSAGLSGISTSDSNSYNLNHPVFGTSHSNSNSFAVGNAAAISQGNVVNGQAISSAQSSAGSSLSAASSGAFQATNFGQGFHNGRPGSLYTNNRQGRPTWGNVSPNYASQYPGYHSQSLPTLSVHERPQNWPHDYPAYRDPIRLHVDVHDSHLGSHRIRPEVHISNGWYQQSPGVQQPWRTNNCGGSNSKFADPRCRVRVTVSKPGTFSTWSGDDGDQIFQPSENIQSTVAPVDAVPSLGSEFAFTEMDSQQKNQASSPSINRIENIRNNSNDKFDANYQTAAGGNHPALSEENPPNQNINVENASNGNVQVQTTVNVGSSSYVKFTDNKGNRNEAVQTIPSQFIRSNFPNELNKKKSRQYNPVGELITDITDAVVELFEK